MSSNCRKWDPVPVKDLQISPPPFLLTKVIEMNQKMIQQYV